MRIDSDGIALIKRFEGRRLEPYQDVAGHWTIGYGHLILPYEDYTAGIDEAAAEGLLVTDVRFAEQGVERLAEASLNQHQFNALVSWVFNLGETKVANATLWKRLNAGRWLDVPAELLKWRKAGGAVQLGLLRRRVAEAAEFLA